MAKKDNTFTVHLRLNEINSDILAMYIKNAKEEGYNKIQFICGDVTRVSFAVLIA